MALKTEMGEKNWCTNVESDRAARPKDMRQCLGGERHLEALTRPDRARLLHSKNSAVDTLATVFSTLPVVSFFLALFSKTQPNHWTKLMTGTRLVT